MDLVAAMRIFAQVAEVNSFTAAAQQLGLSKAGVSAAVAQLEERLGTRLLHRTTRRVQLTPDGQTAYDRARALLAEVETFQALFRHDAGALRGHLRVDLPIGVARDTVLPQLPAFLAAHPHLTLTVSSTDRRVDLVREGYDCVLRIGTLTPSSLIARPLGRMQMINCASPAYLATHGVPRTPADLIHHQLVYYSASGGEPDKTFEYLPPEGGPPIEIPMAGTVTVDSSPAYTAACLAGLGLIQSPVVGLQTHLANGDLVEVLPDHRAVPMPVALLYAHRRHQPERVRVFMDWLAHLMRPRLIP